MTVATTAMTHFGTFLEGALKLEETKRGLGKVFHTAVMTLIAENEGKDGEEMAGIFTATLKELANIHVEKLEGQSINDAIPSFRQYLSNYKRALELAGPAEVRKCGGPADVFKLVQAKRDESNGKTAGNDDASGDAEGGSSTNNSSVAAGNLSDSVQKRLANAMKALEKLDAKEAEEIVARFEGASWAALKRTGTKKAKVAGATGSNNKAAANA